MHRSATVASAVGGTFVLAGPRAITTEEMTAEIASAVGARHARVRVPLWPVLAAAVVMEAGLRPIGIQPPLHRRRMDFFIKSFEFSCQAAKSVLGYQPTMDFRQGARRTAEWYREMKIL
jgi:nucleoside-diphosphate-sugar epimerase